MSDSVVGFREAYEEKRKRNQFSIDTLKEEVVQADYNSMTERQRNAQALAVFYALEGVYKDVLAEFGKAEQQWQRKEEALHKKIDGLLSEHGRQKKQLQTWLEKISIQSTVDAIVEILDSRTDWQKGYKVGFSSAINKVKEHVELSK